MLMRWCNVQTGLLFSFSQSSGGNMAGTWEASGPRDRSVLDIMQSIHMSLGHFFTDSLSHAIENCVAELRSWMISNMLMVNDSKTEFLIVGSKQQLERVNIPFIHVGEDQITPVTSVRNLGVIFDSNLKMDMQITKACQIAYHVHNIRRIRKFLSQEATCTIIHAFITSQIDYCNSLMNGLPENLIKKLQRVQNTAARLVFNLRKYDRITPTLVTLQWLPVKYRIEFKTLLIVFKGLHGKAPIYIQEMITPSKSKRYSIRSNEERVLKVPKFKHDTFGKRAFAVYGPLAWNCLPKEIRLCVEIEAFKRNLKTHLSVKFVNESTLAIWFWRIIVKRPRMLSAQFVALYKPCKPKPKTNETTVAIPKANCDGIMSNWLMMTWSE